MDSQAACHMDTLLFCSTMHPDLLPLLHCMPVWACPPNFLTHKAALHTSTDIGSPYIPWTCPCPSCGDRQQKPVEGGEDQRLAAVAARPSGSWAGAWGLQLNPLQAAWGPWTTTGEPWLRMFVKLFHKSPIDLYLNGIRERKRAPSFIIKACKALFFFWACIKKQLLTRMCHFSYLVNFNITNKNINLSSWDQRISVSSSVI